MLASFRQKKASLEVARRRNQEKTYTEPLLQKDGSKKSQEEMDDVKQFLFDFYKTIYKRRPELNIILEQHPNTVGMYYKKLVPAQVSFEDFWQRYFFRCDEARVVREFEKQFEEARQARTEALSGSVESVKNLFHAAPAEQSPSTIQGTVTADAKENKSAAPHTPPSKEGASGKKEPAEEEITFEEIGKVHTMPVSKTKVETAHEKAEIGPSPSKQPTSKIWFRGKKSSTSSSSPAGKPIPSPVAKDKDEPKSPDQKSTSVSEKAVGENAKSLQPMTDHKTQVDISKERPPNSTKPSLSGATIGLLAFAAIGIIIATLVGSHTELLVSIGDSLCTPVMPGRTLGGSQVNLRLDAPWWVPPRGKSKVFSLICGEDRLQTRLEWTFTGLAQARDNSDVTTIHKLTLLTLMDSDWEASKAVRYLEKKQLTSVEIHSTHITVRDKRGSNQKVVWPWTKTRST